MPRKRGSLSLIASAAIFILLELAAFAMLSTGSTIQDMWIHRASHRIGAALWGTGESLRNHLRLEKQNEALRAENDSLYQEIRRLSIPAIEQAESSNMAYTNDQRFNYIPATVIKMSHNTAHNYIILNKGRAQGVVPQSGIICHGGVVGIVSAVGENFSYGLTIMNPGVTVSTRVGEEGISALMKWDGLSSNGAVVSDIPPHYVINPGDTVRTSGYSSLFPAGITVGVTGESRLVSGSSKQVEVKLLQDLRSIHYVTIVENLDRAEILRLEQTADPEQ